MQDNYFIMANLPICSYFDIEGERHCDVCKNSAVCYGDNLNIIFEKREAAESWYELYKERSIFCRLLDYEAAKQAGQIFLRYDNDAGLVREYKYDRKQAVFCEIGCTAVGEWQVAGKTAQFTANVIKLLQQGK